MSVPTPSTVHDVLEYYTSEVVPALASALTVDDSFPQEVLNEIRNSYTHLARANKLGEGHADYAKEVDGAYRHLKRTCLDCMKVCVFVLAKRADNTVAILEEELQLPNDVHTQMSDLRRDRQKLSAQEGEHPTHEAVNEYKKLFNEFDKFYRSLDAQFSAGTAEDRQKARRSRERKSGYRNMFSGFVLGLVASAIVTLTFNYGMGAWPFNNIDAPLEEKLKD
jgi:hypothetical protein